MSQDSYDTLGRRFLLRQAVGEVDAQGASVEAETRFVYDLEGKLVEKIDALGRSTRLHYDVLGRLTEVTSPLGHRSAFAYDEVGNRTLVESPTGEKIHLEYDARGLVTRRFSEGSASGLDVDDRYGYDGLGRMSAARSTDGPTRFFEYDTLDRAVTMRDPAIGTVRQVFDADGRVVQIGYPGGESVHYGYSARGEVTSVRDPALVALATTTGDWQLAYDALGRPVRERDPFGVERRTSYTEAGFVASVSLRQGASLIETFSYLSYDGLGNPGVMASGEGWAQIQYDPRSRVEKVAYANAIFSPCAVGCERFEYDKVGNRTQHVKDGVAETYVVDADDRLVAIEDAFGQEIASFTHDAAGRRSGRTDASTTTSYAYDPLGRLRTYQVNAFPGSLEYSATDERTTRTDFAGTTRYLGEWYETAPGGQRRLVHGPGIDNVLGQVSNASQVRTLLRDGTANVVRTALDGAVANARRYEAFGRVRSGPLAAERGFAGRPMEGLTSGGLLNVRARHYDPATGRFLQPDPLGVSADQLYAYAANDPYRFRDPTGRQPWSLAGGGPPLSGDLSGNFALPGAGFASQGEPSLRPGDVSNLNRIGDVLFGPFTNSLIGLLESDIEAAGARHSVDSNLIRAVIYEQSAHLGPGEGTLELLGFGNTVGIGQIDPDVWGTTLGLSRRNLFNPWVSVDAVGAVLGAIQAQRAIDPTAPITSIGTRYACGSCASVLDDSRGARQGRRIYHYYQLFSGGASP